MSIASLHFLSDGFPLCLRQLISSNEESLSERKTAPSWPSMSATSSPMRYCWQRIGFVAPCSSLKYSCSQRVWEAVMRAFQPKDPAKTKDPRKSGDLTISNDMTWFFYYQMIHLLSKLIGSAGPSRSN